MNFFKAQDKARRKTKRLVLLFILAVIALIFLTNLLLIGVFSYLETSETDYFFDVFGHNFNTDIIIVVSIGISALIFFGSLYKISSLSKGGRVIAEMLGGKLVPQSTSNHEERQLLNIVEEMSIAAGMPIPKVYLLDESSINAFAAGQSHSTAVIGVTRGALTQLSRDELQGVIAHEFSHIFNGDMRLNIRLMGVLHGILLIGIIGEYLLHSLRYRSSRNDKGGGAALIAVGIGLMVIGYAGTFFGKWIKATVSRQREFLADASAVQFTRNKDTIAGALKKIGGLSEGSILETPSASEYSHAYFANGISSFLGSMFATHPPLTQRIKQIDPGWNGRFIKPKKENTLEDENIKKTKSSVAGMAVTAAVLDALRQGTAEQAINNIGTLSDENIKSAQQLIMLIPENLRSSAQSPYSARAVIYALLIRVQKSQSNINEAWGLLKQHADKGVPELTKSLYPHVSELEENLKLPLIELCVAALCELSVKQYLQFKTTINKIITADESVDLNEWIMQRLILQQLDEYFSIRKPAKAKYSNLGAVKSEAETLMSLLAYVEHKNDKTAKHAFELGKREIGAFAFNIIPRKELAIATLNSSLDGLMQLKPLLKPRILKAFAAIILADNKTTSSGLELFRTISTCLECPVPLPVAK